MWGSGAILKQTSQESPLQISGISPWNPEATSIFYIAYV